jgi:hypothetical protein
MTGDFKPFNTYPQDREKLLTLANRIVSERPFENTDDALELADLVHAILIDEQFGLDHGVYPAEAKPPAPI